MRLPRYLIADVDDTLTVDGFLHPSVMQSLVRASEAGIEIILNTGRPAGYGAALCAYVRGISAVIVENGGAWLDRKHAGASGDRQRHGTAPEIPLCFPRLPPPELRTRLRELSERVARRCGLTFLPTADNDYRITDYTVLRTLPGGAEGARLLSLLATAAQEESGGEGAILASSIHIHFMLDGAHQRSKRGGVTALLRQRGLPEPEVELAQSAVSVGDSANDASLFEPDRFALSVGVRNIERYLPELGPARPRHITRAAEGLGLAELIEDLLSGRLRLAGDAGT